MPYSRLNRLKRAPKDVWPFQSELSFPKALFGFEGYFRYQLIGHQKESPFLRLLSLENGDFFFYTIDPFIGCPDYNPPLAKQDLKDVGAFDDTKLVMLAIVDVKSRPLTMNLAAPLLINWHRKVGKQLLFPHDSAYPLVL